MMMQKSIHSMGMALATTLTLLNLACLLLFLIFPSFTIGLFGSFMHGIDLSKIAINPELNVNSFIGLLVTFIGGYILGIVFAITYNWFNTK